MASGAATAPGIHLLHKPVGPSSHAALEAFRAGPARMCHGGALDPFADGLLLALVGEATRLFPYLHGVPKVYRAEVRWGVETETGDAGGAPVAEGDAGALTEAGLAAALAPFLGWTEQVPPVTSNKRVDGERAYVRAARGEAVSLPPSRVLLHRARWLRHELPTRSWLELTVSGGFYVRALARDLGRRVGASAHLGALSRLAIGPWADPGPGRTQRFQGLNVLPWAPRRRLTADERRGLAAGAVLPSGSLLPAPWPLDAAFPAPPVLCVADGRSFALAEPAAGGLRVIVTLGRGL